MEEEQVTGTETTEEEGLTEDQQQDSTENDQEVIEETPAPELTEETAAPADYQQLYSEQLELTNHILTGQVFFMGLIFGVLLFQIFWSRWKV